MVAMRWICREAKLIETVSSDFTLSQRFFSMARSCKEPIVTENGSGRDSIIWHAVTNLIMFAFQHFTVNTKECVSHNERIHTFNLYDIYM